MKATRAWKFRLYPDKEQTKKMQAHLWLSKNLWNDGLELARQIYRDYGKFPTRQTYQEISKNSGLYSLASQDVLRRLNKAIFGMIARRKKGINAGFPRFKSMDRVKSLTYPQSGFSLKGKKLKAAPFGEINIRKHREMKGKTKTLTLKREGDRWFAIFTTETDEHVPPKKEGNPIGVDLGLMTFATLSSGEEINKPGHFKIYEVKLAEKQRRLSRKKKGSRNARKAKIKVAKVHSKIANTRKDWLHKTANALISRCSLIALEGLNVQGISEEHGRGTSDAGWSIFTNIISYKAESAGCEVVFVNPKNTSKDCSRCGACVPKELHERQHNCPSCGLSMDRDLNAAINILNRAIADPRERVRQSESTSDSATDGTSGSNASGDGTIVPSLKEENEAHGFLATCGRGNPESKALQISHG